MTAKIISSQDISLRPQNVSERIVLENMFGLINSGRKLKMYVNEQNDIIIQVRAED